MRRYVLAISLGFLLVLSGLAISAPSWTFDDPDEIASWEAINQRNISMEKGVRGKLAVPWSRLW